MALLDFLNSDSAALGLGLLAAGGPTTDPNRSGFGSRLAEGVGYAQQRKQQAMQQKLMESQMAENVAQSELQRQKLALALRQQQLDESFMGNPLLGATPGGGTAEAPGGPGPAPMGAPSAGAAPGSPQAGAGAQPVGGGFTAAGIAKQFGIPVEAVISDYRFNGGKKIAELIADRTKANWVNVGGNLVNTNAPGFSGGIQDQVNISNDGRATVLRANGGNPVVGAPQGALETYGAYQGINNRSAADFTPERVIDQDPNSPTYGQTILKPRSGVLQPQGGGAPMGGGGGAPSRPLIGPGASAQQAAAVAAGVPGMRGPVGPTNAAERGMVAGASGQDGMFGYGGDSAAAKIVAGMRRDLADPSKPLTPQERQMMTEYIAETEAAMQRNGGPMIARSPGGAGAGRGSMGMPAAPIASPGAAPQAGGPLIARPAAAGNVVELSPAQQAENAAKSAGAVVAAQEAAKNAAKNVNAPVETANAVAADTAKAEAKDQTEKKIAAPATIRTAQQTLDVIDKAINHPGRAISTGLSSVVPVGMVPGTDAADFDTVRKQLEGKSFLSAFESLKGGGAISEAEGTKAQQAVNRLQTKQSDKAFVDSLKEYRSIVEIGKKNAELIAQGKQPTHGDLGGGAKPPAGSGQKFDTRPPANASNKGRTLRDTETGKLFVSDGMSWKPKD